MNKIEFIATVNANYEMRDTGWSTIELSCCNCEEETKDVVIGSEYKITMTPSAKQKDDLYQCILNYIDDVCKKVNILSDKIDKIEQALMNVGSL
jgi:hypothetical protein